MSWFERVVDRILGEKEIREEQGEIQVICTGRWLGGTILAGRKVQGGCEWKGSARSYHNLAEKKNVMELVRAEIDAHERDTLAPIITDIGLGGGFDHHVLKTEVTRDFYKPENPS